MPNKWVFSRFGRAGDKLGPTPDRAVTAFCSHTSHVKSLGEVKC